MSMADKRNVMADLNRGNLEMPPLDYKFPDEMGVQQNTQQEAPKQAQQQEQTLSDQDQSLQSMFPQQANLYDMPDQALAYGQTEEEDQVQQAEEVEQEEEPIQHVPVQPARNQPKTKEDNFREVRLAKEKAERERDALVSAMQSMQSQLQNQPKQQQQIVEEKQWYDNLDPESLVEGKQVQLIAKDLEAMKKQLREQQQRAYELDLQNKIRSQYPDIDSVVNKETIDMLNEQYPTEASALGAIPDKYNQAVLAYSTIKNLGLYKPVGNQVKKPAYESEVLRAKVNAAKPRPLTSVSPQQGESPLSHANAFANGFTPELQEKLRREMNESARKY